PVAETAAPHRMGTALTYARRYALFTLVGIAGEDDLDAPDLVVEPASAATLDASREHSPDPPQGSMPARQRPNGKRPSGPILAPEASAALRDGLLAEMSALSGPEEAAAWAHEALARKSTLIELDARRVEEAFSLRLAELDSGNEPASSGAMPLSAAAAVTAPPPDFVQPAATADAA